jgi:ABC-type dipeptide/oligopeptide/nickel transport system ATPase component
MYEGEIIESGTAAAIFENPQHEYTRQLIQASRSGFSVECRV